MDLREDNHMIVSIDGRSHWQNPTWLHNKNPREYRARVNTEADVENSQANFSLTTL